MFQSIKPQSIRGTVRILLAIFIIFILSGCASTNSQYQLDLLELETRLGLGEFPKTTSILVSQKGELVYEQYFGKGRADLLNDTRSVTKAISSIVTGKMIENGILGDLNYDNSVDILDVIILVNHILSPAAVELDGADINGDGEVNILDVVALVNIILSN